MRHIIGFHPDDDGDWVAELDCLHSQHVRHRPPFQERPWVLTESGRADRVGSEIDCPLCDRADPPEGLVVVRSAGTFDETTLPAGLSRAHQVPAGTWGLLRVLDGSVDFVMETSPHLERRLDTGDAQPIPPEVRHRLRLRGPVRLRIDFLARPSTR
jgi:tellurite resistance-related uncharacterized protein